MPGERWARLYFGMQALAGGAWWIAVFASPFVRETTLGSLDPVLVAVVDVPLFVLASAVAAFGVKAAAWVSAGWTVLVVTALAIYATVTTEAGWGVLVMAAAAAASVIALCLLVLGHVPTRWIVAGPFAFKRAPSRETVAAHLLATFAQTAVFWGLFLGVLPVAISLLEQRWGVGVDVPGFAVGVVVLVLASALGIWSGATMAVRGDGTPLPAATANRLVIAGPYRYIRNPMALAGIVQGVAVGLMLSSWLVVAYAIIGSLLWNYAVRPLEEADLERRFGDEFRSYRDAVQCWVPRPTRAPYAV